jgi:hypothetical protein
VLLCRHIRPYLLTILALGLALPSGRALLNFDGTRNQVFVFGSVMFGYNSNIYSEAEARGDYSVVASGGVELKRRAGIIAVNAAVSMSYQRFSEYDTENSSNPSISLEFTKSTGRTTGSFSVNIFRESLSDSAVNIRTDSWNLPVSLNLKYPVNDKYYFTSTTAYLQRKYIENESLADMEDISEALDLFYVYTSKLDLMGGYRIRFTQTSFEDESTDHWFSIGATGGIFAKLDGTVRFGYQLRQVRGAAPEDFDQFNMMASLTWPVIRKLTLSGQVSRDFNTIATGQSVDSLSTALRALYSYNRKLSLDTGISAGFNQFLGQGEPPRDDTFFSWDVAARYKVNEHLNVGISFNYFLNWSTFENSDFERQGYALDISSRY